ncbi:MAG: signal peptidase I [Deltaproteobacteria bacterium RBG_16_49_23]|nr:MAG: signal peptidase I [Deltaproteobacteria bacterium RBG_16_49_23]
MDKRKFIKEYLEPIVIAILIALFIRTFIVQAFKIPSSSMEPTLQVGDHILVSKFIYGIKVPFTGTKLFKYKNPQRGDTIVFIYPKDTSKDFIKRVIGIGEDRVDIEGNKVYVNGKQIEDPWGHYDIKNEWRRNLGPVGPYEHVVVPKDHLFVLGDNRDNSQDGRFWGFVNVTEVKGKAFIIYFSWDQHAENLLNKIRWERFGKLIH